MAENSERTVIPLVGEVHGLKKEPTLVKCPSCGTQGLTEVAEEIVTCYQQGAACFLFCCSCFRKWKPCQEQPQDINHYCSNCGCYLGRFRD